MLEIGILLLSLSESVISRDSLAALRCNLEDFRETQQLEFESVEVEGLYTLSFEVSAFSPSDSGERWWVVSRELIALMKTRGVSEIHVILKGKLSPAGRYGHMRSYRHCLAQPKVVKVLDAAD